MKDEIISRYSPEFEEIMNEDSAYPETESSLFISTIGRDDIMKELFLYNFNGKQ